MKTISILILFAGEILGIFAEVQIRPALLYYPPVF